MLNRDCITTKGWCREVVQQQEEEPLIRQQGNTGTEVFASLEELITMSVVNKKKLCVCRHHRIKAPVDEVNPPLKFASASAP